MKIAFWSSARGSSGVTSNLACISIASAIEYSYKSILIENHYQKNKLENVLMYDRPKYHLREEANYQFKHKGMDYIMNQISSEKYETQMNQDTSHFNNSDSFIHKNGTRGETDGSQVIRDGSLEILNNSLYFIPSSYETNKQTFEYNLYGSIKYILEALDEFADITYIDTSNTNNLSSKIILEEVDLVVVNLTQDSSMIENFFDEYSSILSKCVFLISSYHKESSLNIKNISKTHLINKTSIATIPYNVDYQEAVSQGTVVEFLSSNYRCKKRNPNYDFVNEVKKAACMIMNKVELNCKEKCL